MRCTWLLVVLVVPAVAAAKPLPAGLKLSVVKSRLVATRDGMTVPVPVSHSDDSSDNVGKLVSAELTDDGASLSVKLSGCYAADDDKPDATLIPLAQLAARFENMIGMKLHVKKQYAEAIKHFTIAAANDPGAPMFATNLLSAQSMAGKLDDGDQTIATYAKKDLVWWAWRLGVDSDLKAMKSRPSAKLVAAPGTAKGSLIGKFAYSPLGLVATEQATQLWDGIPDGSAIYEMVIVDLKTGKEAMRMPTETTCGVDMERAMRGDKHPGPADKACPKKEAAAAAKHRVETDAVLAGLGFSLVPKAGVDLRDDKGEVKKELAGPEGTKVVIGDKTKVIFKSGKTTELDLDPDHTFELAFVSGAMIVVRRSHGKIMEGCDSADGYNRIELDVVPTK